MKGDAAPGRPGTGPAWLSQRRVFGVLLAIVAGAWLWQAYGVEAAARPIAYSQLYAWIADGKVASVV